MRPAHDAGLQAVEALDEFVAEIAGRARAAGTFVPARLFEWAAGEGSWVVQRLLQRCQREPALPVMQSTLRCAVRHWVAPHLVAHFESLRPLDPELQVRHDGSGSTVLLRAPGWRCGTQGDCRLKLCEC